MLCNMLNDLAEAIRRWTEKNLPMPFLDKGCNTVSDVLNAQRPYVY